jgi:alginate O-acetyltransferase complex protein AlgI
MRSRSFDATVHAIRTAAASCRARRRGPARRSGLARVLEENRAAERAGDARWTVASGPAWGYPGRVFECPFGSGRSRRVIFNDLVFFAVFLVPSVALFHWVGPATKPWVIAGFGTAFFLYFSTLLFGGGWAALSVLILVWECVTSRFYKKGSRFCLWGIVQAILFLVCFKYLGFAARVWNDTASLFAFPELHGIPKLILPLGLSFFTFEFIHYAADCYIGKIERARLADYAAFIFFFPTMVSGPLKRFNQFREELVHAHFDGAAMNQGITRIMVGLAKKHVLADTFDIWASKLNTDALFGASRATVCLQLFAYSWKIYFDFSGYSDIAIGCAKMFGIAVPENFEFPYFLSRNILEFWRRWHISLLAWIESYLFVPLLFSNWRFPGLNGKANVRRIAVVTFAVFCIAGLWHGAAYNFLVFGAYHGALSAGYRLFKALPGNEERRLPAAVSIGITYLTAVAGNAFFAMDMRHARFAVARILGIA